jgi:hypothetical protein
MVCAKVKYPLQLRANQQPVEDGAERAERGNVSHEVAYFCPAARERVKEMFVMPEAIRPDPLFIDKEIWRVDLDDLSQPGDRDA